MGKNWTVFVFFKVSGCISPYLFRNKDWLPWGSFPSCCPSQQVLGVWIVEMHASSNPFGKHSVHLWQGQKWESMLYNFSSGTCTLGFGGVNLYLISFVVVGYASLTCTETASSLKGSYSVSFVALKLEACIMVLSASIMFTLNCTMDATKGVISSN